MLGSWKVEGRWKEGRENGKMVRKLEGAAVVTWRWVWMSRDGGTRRGWDGKLKWIVVQTEGGRDVGRRRTLERRIHTSWSRRRRRRIRSSASPLPKNKQSRQRRLLCVSESLCVMIGRRSPDQWTTPPTPSSQPATERSATEGKHRSSAGEAPSEPSPRGRRPLARQAHKAADDSAVATTAHIMLSVRPFRQQVGGRCGVVQCVWFR